MIGLVIVSHSAHIADGVCELARQMTQGQVLIAGAGGIDDPDNPIGTDPMHVIQAIQSVDQGDDIVVLVDLGSAIMSAETAIEFLDPDLQKRIHICAAPLVEGAVTASVQASIGSSVDIVMREALHALKAKQAHLTESAVKLQIDSARVSSKFDDAHDLMLKLPNKLGLHARPAALLVKIANSYSAQLSIRQGEREASGRSINQIATLNARGGDTVHFIATGIDAEDLLQAVQALVDDNFGDPVEANNKPTAIGSDIKQKTAVAEVLAGVPASEGVAVAPACWLSTAPPQIEVYTVDDVEQEITRFHVALTKVIAELEQIKVQTLKQLSNNEARIFEAQSLMLQDPDLVVRTEQRIRETQCNATSIWWESIEQTARRYEALDDEMLQARAVDVRDVGYRVINQLSSKQSGVVLPTSESIILLAEELNPSVTTQLDPKQVMGIVTISGGHLSHSAILARALGIPAVVGIGERLSAITDGQTIAVDGSTGYVWTKPEENQIKELVQRKEQWLKVRQQVQQHRRDPAITIDQNRIEVVANIGVVSDALLAFEAGAEGVGLFRTEMLFVERNEAPSEQEQFEAYLQVANDLDGQVMTIRTLDIGGDKPIPYLNIPTEANPFLGYRGIRLWLNTPTLAKTQLRAICRVSATHPIQIMFPMISTFGEVQQAVQLLHTTQNELHQHNIAYDPNMAIGIMIEVPSAVYIAEQLARTVDFFSIGTNDLTQYIMAADRGNARINHLIDSFQPAVLKALRHITTEAQKAGIPVSVCGEMAADSLATPLLIGMGIQKLSMSASSIAKIKSRIRSMSLSEAQQIAAEALKLNTADDIRTFLKTYEQGHTA